MTQAMPATPSEGFVSIQDTVLDQPALAKLIQRCLTGDTWHCWRSPQAIALDVGLPTDCSLSSPKGQVFNQDRELRWKRQGSEYAVLLLSSTKVDDPALKPLKADLKWFIRDLSANFYPPPETRFPRGVTYPKDLDIGQRYFIDRETGIVQFVALKGVKRGK